MKKLISILLSIAILFSITASSSINSYAKSYSGTCGQNAKWEYNSSTETLSITGTGDIDKYPSGSSPWNTYRKSIRNIEISEGITKIGTNAFSECTSVSSIVIPKSVTGIYEAAFWGCTSLKEVVILGKIKNIRSGTYYNCTSLEKIWLPASTQTLGYNAFANCTSLKEIHYAGSEEQFNAFVQLNDGGNDCFLNAKVIFNEAITAPSKENTTNAEPASESTNLTTTALEATTVTTTVLETTTTVTSTKKLKATSISKLTKGKKQFKVTWKTVSGVTGYQIQCSTDKKFKKGNKTVTIKGAKKTSTTVKKLKSKKTYYVRIRTYKGKNYSAWSKAKTVKVK